jgi:glycosyltransferase involved in cell wall biosynthesis
MSGTGVNGVAVHCVMLIQFLLSRGHTVLLLHRPGAWIADRPGLAGAELFATSFARSPRELIRVTRRLNAFHPDVLHTHMSSAHTYGMLARILSRRPIVATAHSTSLQLHWWFNNVVIATSPAAAEHHQRVNRVSANAIRMIPNFIDTSAFPVITSDERRAARELLGITPDAFVIGSVGDISPRKRQIELVQTLAAVLPNVPEARLLLAGAPHQDYVDELMRTADRLGVRAHLVLPGARNDIPTLLAAFDLFALSSGKETGPIAVLEAMARALPVVATDCGMVAEFINEGISGHVVGVGDTAAMAQHIIALARDSQRRETIGHAAALAVRATYDIAALAPKIERELAEAAKIRNRPLLGFVAHNLGS